MASFSVVGIGLSFAFGCMLLGLVAELYYLLWWKKRISNIRVVNEGHYNNNSQIDGTTKEPSSHLMFRWRKPDQSSSTSEEITDSVTTTTDAIVADLEMGVVVKKGIMEEEGSDVECEIMRMYNLCGPPRFLFTIKEETKDEMESDDDDGKSSRTTIRMLMSDSPFLSPLGSPLKNHNLHHGYNLNPLFEQFTEAEEEVINRVRCCSPPPKFKFLRDAEEKLMRRLILEEAEKKAMPV